MDDLQTKSALYDAENMELQQKIDLIEAETISGKDSRSRIIRTAETQKVLQDAQALNERDTSKARQEAPVRETEKHYNTTKQDWEGKNNEVNRTRDDAKRDFFSQFGNANQALDGALAGLARAQGE